jgi:hypothetical protein
VILLQPSRLRLPGSETSRGRQLFIHSLGQDPVMMIPRSMFAALCALGSLTCVAQGGNVNGEATYISFSVPGAFGTYPTGINASMEVTGSYSASSTVRGFLREADGTITTFAVGGASSTVPEGINAAGDITGYYQPGLQDGHGVSVQGFLRYADGHIIIVDAPQAYYAVGAQPVSISDFDEIAGTYIAAGPGVFTRSGAGVLTDIQAPGGGSAVATAIHASGSVVGWFSNDTFINNGNCKAVKTGGFVMSPDGELNPVPTAGDDSDLALAHPRIRWSRISALDQSAMEARSPASTSTTREEALRWALSAYRSRRRCVDSITYSRNPKSEGNKYDVDV